MIHPVGLWLLTAHLIGDFPLQPDWMAQKKAWLDGHGLEKLDGVVTLTFHVLIHGFLAAPIAYYTLTTGMEMMVFLGWLMGTHFLIDSKRWVDPKESWENSMLWVWLNDQILHLASLSLAYPVTITLL